MTKKKGNRKYTAAALVAGLIIGLFFGIEFMFFFGGNVYVTNIDSDLSSGFPPQAEQFCSNEGDYYICIWDMQWDNWTYKIVARNNLSYWESDYIEFNVSVWDYDEDQYNYSWYHLFDGQFPIDNFELEEYFFEELFGAMLPAFAYNDYTVMASYLYGMIVYMFEMAGFTPVSIDVSYHETICSMTKEANMQSPFFNGEVIVDQDYYAIKYDLDATGTDGTDLFIVSSDLIFECTTGISLMNSLALSFVNSSDPTDNTALIFASKTVLSSVMLPLFP